MTIEDLYQAIGHAALENTLEVSGADFNDRGRLFQADRGQRFNAIVDARGLRASEVVNVSQSSTISLKRCASALLSMRP